MNLQPAHYSERMGARIKVVDNKGVAIAMLEVKVLRQGDATLQEAATAVADYVVTLQQLADEQKAKAQGFI